MNAQTLSPSNDNLPPGPTMLDLLAHRPAPRAPARVVELPASRMPLAEEFTAGRFNESQGLALDWWVRTHSAGSGDVSYGGGSMNVSGVHQPFISRPADALFAQELAAERSLLIGRVYKLLGSLVVVIEDALAGAEMRSLAPRAMTFPQDKRAMAGRIRLGAALDIVARFAEGSCSVREALEIVIAAADACSALVAKRMLRADNANIDYVKKAVA